MKMQSQTIGFNDSSLSNSSYNKSSSIQQQQIGSSSKTKNNDSNSHRIPSSSNGSKPDERQHKEFKNQSKGLQNSINPLLASNYQLANNNYKMPIIDLSSDDNEFQSSPPKKPKSHKHKHNKKNKDLDGIGGGATITAHSDLKTNEVDHNQIIHDLKVNSQLFGRHFDLHL